jgi:hypothetical protein
MWYSDSVNLKRTDNAMTQRKGIKNRQRSTKHYTENSMITEHEPLSSAEELELSNTEYITDVVDSSAEELQLSNTKYITDVVDSSVEELQQPYDTIEN